MPFEPLSFGLPGGAQTPNQKSKRDIIIEGADILSKKGYLLTPRYVLRTKAIDGYAKLIYSMLLDYAWYGNSVFPGQEKLADDCGVKDPKTVRKYLRQLHDNGFITIKRRGQGRTNLYTLHLRRPKKTDRNS